MIHCQSCASENLEASRFCSSCGGALKSELSATVSRGAQQAAIDANHEITRDSSSHHGRFLPGTKIAGRYRIVSLAGKGGMGEVYRADDLKLGQTVALKFLPKRLANDHQRLELFHTEVRLARQISHPNVCRVYDIGEVDGQHFLSMEYIDGEDLRGLLRRIGRLPNAKGVQIAQQLCAGLMAAHEKGVLHRDLKPANVMLDGRGQVRITDFGLARLADDGVVGEIAGTPAYMAPEQLARGQATIQSDLFSLGLIFHEIFTGEMVFDSRDLAELKRLHENFTAPSLSKLAPEIDPAVERVIQRCLEFEPAERPKSVRAVSAALPGGDPLAAALAEGETPSPELIANSGEEGVLPLWQGLALLGLILVGFVVGERMLGKMKLYRLVSMEHSPREQAITARKIVRELGYTDPPKDEVYGLYHHRDAIELIHRTTRQWKGRSAGDAAPMFFWYRRSPLPLATVTVDTSELPSGIVTPFSPPQIEPGMITVCLDLEGRLIEFLALPPAESAKNPVEQKTIDWESIFKLAGLSLQQFRELRIANPQRTPPVFGEEILHWTVQPDQNMAIQARVEAILRNGRLVFLHVGPKLEGIRYYTSPPLRNSGTWLLIFVLSFIIVLTVTIGVILAFRNYRLGKANQRGAVILTLIQMVAAMTVWFLSAHHVQAFSQELRMLIFAIGFSFWSASLILLSYLALEPAVRRRWPWRMTAWNRLLMGRWRDPLVGRSILVGCTTGGWVGILQLTALYVPVWLGGKSWPPLATFPEFFTSPSLLIPADAIVVSLSYVMLQFFFFFVMTWVLRSEWLALAMISLVMGVAGSFVASTDYAILVAAIFVLGYALGYLLLMRFGLLAYWASSLTIIMGSSYLLTTDLNTWYAQSTLTSHGIFFALVIYSFVISIDRRLDASIA